MTSVCAKCNCELEGPGKVNYSEEGSDPIAICFDCGFTLLLEEGE